MILGISSTTFAAAFEDVPMNNPSREAVLNLAKAGIISTSDRFNGDRDATKYETATMFCKLLSDIRGIRVADQNDSFTDVPRNHWAHEYVATLANNGIIPTSSSTFNGANPVTRFELATMFYNAFADKSLTFNRTFSDVSSDNPNLKAAQWAVESRVMSSDGSFRGNDPISRYDLAQLIDNLYEEFSGGN